jgi:hypothetical protein
VDRKYLGKPEGKKRVGRAVLRWEDNTKMYLREMGWGVCRLDPSDSGQRSREDVDMEMKLWVS